MKELGVKLPEWKSENGKTCLTIFKTTIRKTIPERALKFLSSCHKGDSFGKRDYVQAFDDAISETSAKNDLSAMVNMGVVELSLERKVLIKCEMGNVRITEYLQRNYKNTQYHL